MEEKYPHKTVGQIMTNKVPTVSDNATVGDVEALLIKEAANFETINYVYLLDADKKLKGVISLKELFRSPKIKLAKDLMPEKVISIHVHTNQERAALLALKHNLKALPVVDKENHFLGVLTSDNILKILDSEAVENILRFGGVTHFGTYDNILNISIFTALKHRLPWLIIGLFGGLLTAGLVGSFKEVISQHIILAAFIPLIVYMADSVSTQMEAFMIRDLAIEPDLKFFKYFFRQFLIVIIIAVVTSVGLYGVNLMTTQDHTVNLILSVALFIAVISSVSTGLIIPYIFGKLSLDPANASGPIGTIIQDFLSVFIYFTVAARLLS
ncbi:MAG: CBS domain-containing protein [Candidatus Taylorbacteria bacterium]|nr:CBS domain-containing protein [Candidatus Taylorbacteria bacterium]